MICPCFPLDWWERILSWRRFSFVCIVGRNFCTNQSWKGTGRFTPATNHTRVQSVLEVSPKKQTWKLILLPTAKYRLVQYAKLCMFFATVRNANVCRFFAQVSNATLCFDQVRNALVLCFCHSQKCELLYLNWSMY